MTFNAHILKIRYLILTIVITIHTQSFAQNDNKYMGTASCSSSNCHGNSAAVAKSEVLQNEFVTWYRHDKHSKAYAVLQNEQSKRIAYNLGIKSAENEPQCLACHATYVPDTNARAEKYRVEDGVSCESCHGASSQWLKEHVASDASHQKNVSLGMRDLSNKNEKIGLCLSCHLGNDEKHVNHRLIGAGHPRLSFEVDTFESVMPRHWKNENKGYDPAMLWFNGQAIQAAERTKALYSKNRSHAGLFPEFTNLHCYSCHHALSQKQFENREYEGNPGQANLNTAELWVLSKALISVNKPLADKLTEKLSKLRAQYGKEDSTEISQQLVQLLKNEVLPDVTKLNLSSEQKQKIFKDLVEASHLNLQYEVAEQIAMGAAAIAASSSNPEQMKAEVDRLYSTLNDPDLFDPKLFKKARKRE